MERVVDPADSNVMIKEAKIKESFILKIFYRLKFSNLIPDTKLPSQASK